MRGIFYSIIIFLCCCGCGEKKNEDRSPENGVYIKKSGERYVLMKNNSRYIIKGAAGDGLIRELHLAGGNSIRTWDAENARAILDSASKYNISVILGLYLGSPRDGFNYADKNAVLNQRKRLIEAVERYKNHPALLMWGVGNEVEYYPKNKNIWKEINYLSTLIKKHDPQHPTTTMIFPSRKGIAFARLFLDNIDVLSINTFGSIQQLKAKLNLPFLGWNKPVIYSEWGLNGPWEEASSEITSWDAPIEKTSQVKTKMIKERYKDFIEDDNPNLLGAYVFYWGNKRERTDTWFSIFSTTNERTSVYHVMKELWSDQTDDNKVPVLDYMLVNGKNVYSNLIVKSGQTCSALVYVSDPEGDSLRFQWRVRPESLFKDETEARLFGYQYHDTLTYKTTNNRCSFEANLPEGAYRLFVEVRDGHNNIATANFPFYTVK